MSEACRKKPDLPKKDAGDSGARRAGHAFHPDRNPSPPSSENEEEEPPGDCIGNTVYSKHWFFTALTRLIDAVKEETDRPEEEDEGEESGGAELEEDLENDLCKVWDMSMNEEICVGILGNMACFQGPCLNLSSNSSLGEVLLLLLNGMDPPTLLETSRLLLTCLSQVEVMRMWLERIRKTPCMRDNLCFIMSCSTNADLLVKVGELVDKLFDADEDIMVDWIKAGCQQEPETPPTDDERPSPPGLVPSLLGAAKQLRYDSPEGLDVYMHILQLVTTVEEGVRSIVVCGEVGKQTWDFLYDLISRDLCQPSDPPLMVREQKSLLSSILAVMSVIFSSQREPEYMESGKDLALISSLARVLEKSEAGLQKNGGGLHDGGGAGESATEEDFHLKILKDVCCEFLSNILSQLTKENILQGIRQGHITEETCLCALRNLIPLYSPSVRSFVAVLGEAEPRLSETLRKEIAALAEEC
ncbi:LOW QUALITY PROTEIN: protein SAAL1 [Mantella aurantiaca]